MTGRRGISNNAFIKVVIECSHRSNYGVITTMRTKRSKIWKISILELQSLLDSCSSYVEVLKKLGFNAYAGNHRTLKQRIVADNLDTQHLDMNRKKTYSGRKRLSKSNEEVFVQNASHSDRYKIKLRLVSLGRKYECSECLLGDSYNDKPLSLQLDHINGVSNDNRLENLRFLCPNCHSQTPTFAGKRFRQTYLCSCGKEMSSTSEHCKQCQVDKIVHYNDPSRKTKINWPSPEEIQKLVWEISTVQLAKQLGVSDNAISKFCKTFNISKPPRGYWSQKKHGAI